MTGRGISCSTCGTVYVETEFTELCCSTTVDVSPIRLRFAALSAAAESELGSVSVVPAENLRLFLVAAGAIAGRVDALSRMVALRNGLDQEPVGVERIIGAAMVHASEAVGGVDDEYSVAVESSMLTALAWAGYVAAESMKHPMLDVPVGTRGETASATVIHISPRVLYVGVVLAGVASVRRVSTREDALPQALDRPLSFQEVSAIANAMDDLDVDGTFSGEPFSQARRAALVDFILTSADA